MKRSVFTYGEAVLRKKAAPVTEITDEVRTLVTDMLDTMEMKDHIALGLAAPQVGVSLAIFIAAVSLKGGTDEQGHPLLTTPRVFINPKLSKPSKETSIELESCFSLPGISGEVERPNEITVTAMDLDGNTFEERLVGFPARVIMHENDHLNGTLYIDRMDPKKRKELQEELHTLKKAK